MFSFVDVKVMVMIVVMMMIDDDDYSLGGDRIN